MFSRNSLAPRLIGAILVTTLVISAVGAVVAASVYRRAIEQRQLDTLDAFIGERAERVNELFQYVAEAHQASAAALDQRLAQNDIAASAAAFDEIFPPFGDGSRRSIDALYEGRRDESGDWRSQVAGIFTPPGALTEADRALLYAAYTVVDRGGEMYRRRISNLYFYTQDNQLIISATGRPDDLLFYRREAPGDWDFRDSSLVGLIDPSTNPNGVFVCDELSPVLYDPESQALTTGCFTPYERDGVRVGAFGTTIDVAEYFEAAMADAPPNGENLFINGSGNLITHAELLDGAVTPERVASLAARLDLDAIVDAIGAADHGAAISPGDRRVIAWSRIPGPGWSFVSVVDHSVLRAEANRQALAVLGVALLGVIAQAVIIAILLHRSVISPLRALNNAFGANSPRRAAPPASFMAANHEIGELARSLEGYSHAREEALEELEDRVAERTRELQAAKDARGDFLARMSHELRTPLNAVINLASALETDTETDQAREKARLIKSSGESLNYILNDVLDMSKIEAGKLEIAPEWTDISELLGDMVRLFTPNAEAKGVTLTLAGAETLPDLAFTDPHRLRQCLTNLLSNAIKFTSEGGVEVRVAARRDSELSHIAIEVADSGLGVAPDKLATLFTPFTQADATTASQFGGTGLGLAITRQLASLLGGAVSARSTLGEGSVFTLEFTAPAKNASASADTAASSPRDDTASHGALEGLRVLLVEDNPTNRFVVTSMLQKQKMAFTEAENGERALEALGDAEFDLILMDVQMPVMDGFETTRRIREAAGPVSDSPIVALTAHAAPEDVRRCLDAGMDAYASKPLSAPALLTAISEALRRRGRTG